jgi:hypothetical protein
MEIAPKKFHSFVLCLDETIHFVWSYFMLSTICSVLDGFAGYVREVLQVFDGDITRRFQIQNCGF